MLATLIPSFPGTQASALHNAPTSSSQPQHKETPIRSHPQPPIDTSLSDSFNQDDIDCGTEDLTHHQNKSNTNNTSTVNETVDTGNEQNNHLQESHSETLSNNVDLEVTESSINEDTSHIRDCESCLLYTSDAADE